MVYILYMNTSVWNNNKNLLWTIVKECIDDAQLLEHTKLIYKNFEHTMNQLFNKQYDFKNFTELNKYVINDINKKMEIIKMSNSNNTRPQRQPQRQPHNNNIDANYTRKGLQIQRQDIFNKQLASKQKELELYNTRPQKNIDFTDKTTDEMDNIDDLLEQEMAKRTREMNIIMDENKKTNTKNVEKWIHNSDNSNKNDSNNKIIIHDKMTKYTHNTPTNVITDNSLYNATSSPKKVSFGDLPIKSGTREENSSFLNRLKPILQKPPPKSIPSTDMNKYVSNSVSNNIMQQTQTTVGEHIVNQNTERDYIYSQLNMIQNQLNNLTTQISTIQDYIIVSSKQTPIGS